MTQDLLTIAQQIQRLQEFDAFCRAQTHQFGAYTGWGEGTLRSWQRCQAALAVYEAFLQERLPEDFAIGLPKWWTSQHKA